MTVATTGGWFWVAGRSYVLTAGLHSLELGGREAQRLASAPRPRDERRHLRAEHEQPVDDPDACPGGSQVGLRPPQRGPEHAQLDESDERRFLEDGRPLSHGREVPDEPRGWLFRDRETRTTRQRRQLRAHRPDQRGCVFVLGLPIDTAGNVAIAATATGTPTDVSAPANVNNVRPGVDTQP